MLSSIPLLTPIAFSYTTLVILWTFAGGDLAQFWQRIPILAASLLILVGITKPYSWPILKAFSKKSFWSHKDFKTGLLAAIALSIPFLVVFFTVRASTSENLAWLSSYLKNIATPQWYAVLLLPFIVSPILEIYWRGILSVQWGLFTVAFLEGLVWGFASQHFVFFAVAFTLAVVGQLLHKRVGLHAAIVFRSLWTLLLILAAFAGS
jgi:hypothetical protein